LHEGKSIRTVSTTDAAHYPFNATTKELNHVHIPVISGDGKCVFRTSLSALPTLQKSVAFYETPLWVLLASTRTRSFNTGWYFFGREKPAFIIAPPGQWESAFQHAVNDRLWRPPLR